MLNFRKLLFLTFVCYGYVMCEYLDLREGAKCSWNNDTGTCINVYNCLRAKTDIPGKVFLPICSYEGETPIVCCTDCHTDSVFDFRDEVINPNVGALWNTGPQNINKFNEYLDTLDYPCKRYLNTTYTWTYIKWKKCYERTRSLSGTSEGIDFPRDPELIHTALLGYGGDLKSAQWLCGGSIISENFILTSANCTSSPLHGPVTFVVMGLLNGTGEPWQSHRVKRIIIHHEYRPTSKYHDIALLETATKIQFNEQVAPISIHLGKAPNPFRAVAWSELGHGKSLSETLKSVSLTTLSYYKEEYCSLLFPPQPGMDKGFNSTIQFCFTYQGSPIDVCEGDSGASIHSKENTGCAYSVLGVTSIGRVCGKAGGAALYTRVYYYVPWIESIVWPGEYFSYTRDRRTKLMKKSQNKRV